MARRRSPGWLKTEIGGMPMWGLLVALVFLVGAGSVAAISQTTPSTATWNRYTAEPSESPAPATTVAFLGDSYSPAQGQEAPEYNFATIIANRIGWNLIPFGQGGTGYTNPGQSEEGESVYLDRVPAVVAADPDVVIVQGGTNDRDYAPTLDAANSVLAQLKAGLPQATIIVMGPLTTPDLGPELLSPVQEALNQAATNAGVLFVDPTSEGWLGRDASLFVDGVHPNSEGQRLIADSLLAHLQSVFG